MKVLPSQGGKSKEKKIHSIVLKEGRLSAQPRGKKQKQKQQTTTRKERK